MVCGLDGVLAACCVLGISAVLNFDCFCQGVVVFFSFGGVCDRLYCYMELMFQSLVIPSDNRGHNSQLWLCQIP